MRFHKLQNVQIALDYLRHRQVRPPSRPGHEPLPWLRAPSLAMETLPRPRAPSPATGPFPGHEPLPRPRAPSPVAGPFPGHGPLPRPWAPSLAMETSPATSPFPGWPTAWLRVLRR